MNAYSNLSPALREELDRFLDAASAGSRYKNRRYCSRFLLLMQNRGIQNVSEIKVPDLVFAMNTVMSVESKNTRESLLSSVKRFFIFESENDVVVDSLPLMLKYYPRNQVLYLNDFTDDERIRIIEQKGYEYTAEEFHHCTEQIIDAMKEMNYCHWHVVNLKKIADLHYLFLSVSSLPYKKETYLIWRNLFVEKILHGLAVFKNTNKLLGFVEQWKTLGKINPEKYNRMKVLPYDTLPPWCRETLDAFLLLKRKEGWKSHTVMMYRSSVIRFCVYLIQNGFTSFSEVTPEIVKQFNLQDRHKTPEGKNAYNSRIRKFLDYLGEKNIVSSRLLFLALPCVAAPSTRIVVTLTEEEDQELERLILSDDSPLTLRDKAMLALGRYLGMRESDVVGLCGFNIDLKNKVISFVQKKTSVQNTIPFSVKIGNLLYRYVTEERPDTDDPHVFIRNCVPYTKIRDSAACDAFKKAFPNRDVPGSNYHCLRKTFNTELLKSGVKASKIAELDGHRGLGALHVYLSTNGENMRKCARSLYESGIPMKEMFPI